MSLLIAFIFFGIISLLSWVIYKAVKLRGE